MNGRNTPILTSRHPVLKISELKAMATQFHRKEVIGVYAVTCVPANMVYVGSSENVYRRMWCHARGMRGEYHRRIEMINDFVRFGDEAFVFQIIELCDSIEIAKARELEIIALLWKEERSYNRIGLPIQRVRKKPIPPDRGVVLRQWMTAHGKDIEDLAAVLKVNVNRAQRIMRGSLPFLPELRRIRAWTKGAVHQRHFFEISSKTPSTEQAAA